MNEYDYIRMRTTISVLTISEIINLFLIMWIVTGNPVSLTAVIFYSACIISGLSCLFVVEKFRKEYYRSLEALLDGISETETKQIIERIQAARPPRWSVLQYRGFNDFNFGSFDAYVTEKEIIIRGRLKRGQHSLYMRIVNTNRR
jgi:hypothetical protein